MKNIPRSPSALFFVRNAGALERTFLGVGGEGGGGVTNCIRRRDRVSIQTYRKLA